MEALDSEEKRFMGIPSDGTREFQILLRWEISRTHQGVNVNFCRAVSDRLEKKFQQTFNRPSKISKEGRLWISESTVSRWLRSKTLDVKVQLLEYLSQTHVLVNPETLAPLSTNELLEILQGRLKLTYLQGQPKVKKNS